MITSVQVNARGTGMRICFPVRSPRRVLQECCGSAIATSAASQAGGPLSLDKTATYFVKIDLLVSFEEVS